jgi:enoyl-CoA hydratase/carnithine racemase
MAEAAPVTYETIQYEIVEDHIAVVTLNRPQKLNAMNPAFFTELLHCFHLIDLDPMVRAAVIKANGRLFSAGLDLTETSFANNGEDPAR